MCRNQGLVLTGKPKSFGGTSFQSLNVSAKARSLFQPSVKRSQLSSASSCLPNFIPQQAENLCECVEVTWNL